MVRFGVLVLCWGGVAAGVLGSAVHFYPVRSQIAAVLAAGAPVLMVAVIPAVVGFAVLRRWIGVAIAATVLVAGALTQAPLFLGNQPAAGQPLVVMQANIGLGQGDVQRIAELVATHDVDILAIEELTPSAARDIEKAVGQQLPHSFVEPRSQANGTGVWSRYPISAQAQLDGFTMAALRMTVEMPGVTPIEFFALHPLAPYPWPTQGWLDELGRLGGLLAAVGEGRPVVAAGDFNSTFDHRPFRQLLTGGYGDAGELAGAGWLPTYPADRSFPPVIGIDHVLVRGVGAQRVTREKIAGSDHLAVVAELVLPPR